jgi:hypothetical protein
MNGVYLHIFLTLAQMQPSSQLHIPAAFPWGDRLDGAWVGWYNGEGKKSSLPGTEY